MKIKVKKKLKFVPALFKFQDNVKSLQALFSIMAPEMADACLIVWKKLK